MVDAVSISPSDVVVQGHRRGFVDGLQQQRILAFRGLRTAHVQAVQIAVPQQVAVLAAGLVVRGLGASQGLDLPLQLEVLLRFDPHEVLEVVQGFSEDALAIRQLSLEPLFSALLFLAVELQHLFLGG